MKRPSPSTSTVLAWTVLSQAHTQAIPLTSSGTLCGLQLHLDSQQRVISTPNFLKECKGAGTKGSPPIHTFFKTTPPTQPGGTSEGGTQAAQDTPMSTARPRPKRLHFSTPLTEREDEQNPTQAMTPSQAAGPRPQSTTDAQPTRAATPQTASPPSSQETDEEEHPAVDAEMHVDY